MAGREARVERHAHLLPLGALGGYHVVLADQLLDILGLPGGFGKAGLDRGVPVVEFRVEQDEILHADGPGVEVEEGLRDLVFAPDVVEVDVGMDVGRKFLDAFCEDRDVSQEPVMRRAREVSSFAADLVESDQEVED